VQEIRDLKSEVSSLEKLVNEYERRGHMQRWRLQERQEELEEGLGTIAKVVASNSGLSPSLPFSFYDLTTPRRRSVPLPMDALPLLPPDDPLWVEAEKEKDRLQASPDVVTAVVHYTVRRNRFAAFEDMIHGEDACSKWL